jgi:hypothetical protein
MAKGVKELGPDETVVKFFSRDFTAESDPIVVPKGAVIVLIPSGNVYQIYDEPKRMQHEGEWTLNGVKQPPPVLHDSDRATKTREGGSVVIQRLGGPHVVETHMHRWYVIGEGPLGQPAVLGCRHVYADLVPCDTQNAQFGVVEGWGSRYYQTTARVL